MSIQLDRDELVAALNAVKPAVGGHPPVCSGVRLEVSDGIVDVTATNLDLWAQFTFKADHAETVDMVIPHHRLLTVVKAGSPGDVVTFDVDEVDPLTVAVSLGGRVRATLRLYPVTEWPRWPEVPASSTQATFDRADWTGIARVAAACANEDTRPVLRFVHLHDDLVEATNSYWLARHPIDFNGDLLLPGFVVAAVDREHDPDDPVVLTFDGHHVCIESGPMTWGCFASGESYPNLNGLIPGDGDVSVTVDRDELTRAVALAGAFTEGDVRPVVIDVDAGRVALSSMDSEVGSADVTLEATTVGDCRFALGARWFAGLLGACEADNVTLSGTTPLKPWKVVDGELTQVLMPVRLAQ